MVFWSGGTVALTLTGVIVGLRLEWGGFGYALAVGLGEYGGEGLVRRRSVVRFGSRCASSLCMRELLSIQMVWRRTCSRSSSACLPVLM